MTTERVVRSRRRRSDRDGGFVIAMFALTLTGLLVFAGFSVDVGAWYARASQIQRGADAAALAGVVWMPNFPKAEEVALQAAARNGFVHNDAGPIKVVVTEVAGRSEQLRVTITDERVDQYFSSLVMDPSSITRRAVAQYVLPVPLGSPRNFFGTGTLNTGHSENLALSINTWCSDKVDGDRFQSRYVGNRPYGSADANCPLVAAPLDSKTNGEYRERGYELYIEAVEGRTFDIEVLLWDPQYNKDGSFVNDGNPLWNNASNRYHDFTFTLFSADDTPLDDSDNPQICSRTFSETTPYDYGPYLGSSDWNRLCTIRSSDPDGRYILRVTNTPGDRYAAGSNEYAVVARPSISGNGICDGRNDAMCPRVYGKDAISVYASQSSASADFYLTEIDPVHAGKTMRITLWDPGEGGNNIRIRRPTGTDTWADAEFSWSATNGGSMANQTSLDVSGTGFNGHLVTIDVDLDGYAPPADNEWWQIQYNFGSGTVTDRTTWGVNIIGDPVHLVE